MSTEERKLAAIVFTDIVGFTELMGRDEAKAMNLLKQNRALLRPIVENFKGEWLKEIGDGVLISFPSAVMAVTCALEIQRILAHNPDLTLRIGIHVGDVIQKDGDVFGDGVNIASRLEPLAEPGGICVSERVHEDIRNKPEISTAFQEEQLLKGVDKPIKVYSIFTQMGVAPTPESLEANSAKKSSGMNMGLIAGVGALVLAGVLFFIRDTTPDKPKDERKSIAVLPFDNMSEEGNSDYFSDGITEDIITYLSKIEGLKVISRTSIMQYKDTKMNLKDIAKELGVTNILEGSVRRSGDKVRITGQLIDAETDEHLWAEMYDRTLDDIFTVQTEVAKSIAAALETEMTDKDIERLNKTMTTNPDAYELLHKTKTLKWFIPDDNFKKLEFGFHGSKRNCSQRDEIKIFNLHSDEYEDYWVKLNKGNRFFPITSSHQVQLMAWSIFLFCYDEWSSKNGLQDLFFETIDPLVSEEKRMDLYKKSLLYLRNHYPSVYSNYDNQVLSKVKHYSYWAAKLIGNINTGG